MTRVSLQAEQQVRLASNIKVQVASLVQQRLAQGSEMRLQIASGSMEPLLLSGDWVTVRGTPLSALRRGDLVCSLRHGHLVVHRLLGRSGAGEGARLLTRGDCSSRPDEPWAAADLLGRVVSARSRGRTLVFERARWRWTNRLYGGCLALRTRLTEGAVPRWGRTGRHVARLVCYPSRLWMRLAIRAF